MHCLGALLSQTNPVLLSVHHLIFASRGCERRAISSLLSFFSLELRPYACVCVRVCVCQRVELDLERKRLLVFVSRHIGYVSLTPEFVCAADSTAEPAGYRSEISAVRICSEGASSWLMRRCGVAVKSYPQNSSVIDCIVLLVITFQKLHLGNGRRRMQSKTPNRFRSRGTCFNVSLYRNAWPLFIFLCSFISSALERRP